jgi:DNA-binding FadR family transcriptional regulator
MAELLAGDLRRHIVRGRLGIGDKLLPEDELATAFGITPTMLGEALRTTGPAVLGR